MKKIITFFFAIFFITNLANSNEYEIRLNNLFEKLKIQNHSIAIDTEMKIWDIWTKHPTNQNLTSLLSRGTKFMNQEQYSVAVDIFTTVIKKDPAWAEAWNKRATVFYLMGKYQDSQNDIDKVLKLEKRHFGALSGQGLVQIKLKNYEKALKSYEKVKEIYPSMRSPQIMIPQIKELIKNQSCLLYTSDAADE